MSGLRQVRFTSFLTPFFNPLLLALLLLVLSPPFLDGANYRTLLLLYVYESIPNIKTSWGEANASIYMVSTLPALWRALSQDTDYAVRGVPLIVIL